MGDRLSLPKKVSVSDITVRDGFQAEQKFIPTEAKAARYSFGTI